MCIRDRSSAFVDELSFLNRKPFYLAPTLHCFSISRWRPEHPMEIFHSSRQNPPALQAISYLKTLSVGPAEVELTTSSMTARCSTNWAAGLGLRLVLLFPNPEYPPQQGLLAEIRDYSQSQKLFLIHRIPYTLIRVRHIWFSGQCCLPRCKNACALQLNGVRTWCMET